MEEELDLFIISKLANCSLDKATQVISRYNEIISCLPELELEIGKLEQDRQKSKLALDKINEELVIANNKKSELLQSLSILEVNKEKILLEIDRASKENKALFDEKLLTERLVKAEQDKLRLLESEIKEKSKIIELKEQVFMRLVHKENDNVIKFKADKDKELAKQREQIAKEVRRVEKMLHKNLILERGITRSTKKNNLISS